MGFIVDFGDTSKYTVKTSQAKTDLVPKEGMYRAQIVSVDEGKSASGNMTLRFNMVISDPDASGLRVAKTIPVTGVNAKGQKNIDQLLPVYESILSTDTPADQLQAAVQKKTNGRKGNSSELIAEFLGKTVYLDIRVKPLTNDDGRVAWVSDVAFFISKDKLETFERRLAHRRALAPAAEQYRLGTGSSGAGGHELASDSDQTVV